ncbi:MAG: cob(I)yrinic acid a,c-diamide adenosyltransferase [Rubrivivax sp.]|nr:cob(I)yrinic acid a,c-diamide adenosyltransferase [Rubrivivax sp.]
MHITARGCRPRRRRVVVRGRRAPPSATRNPALRVDPGGQPPGQQRHQPPGHRDPTREEVLVVLRDRPAQVHVVVTGRNAPQALVEQADTVTRMGLTKHHCMLGVPSQRGIED